MLPSARTYDDLEEKKQDVSHNSFIERYQWARDLTPAHTDAMLLTKLCASCSTPSPSCFSGAPVMDVSEARTPEGGFCTPPVFESTMDGGAGGKQIVLAGG